MNRKLEQILREHAARYPKMEPTDAVKLIFQNEFGGGHMIRDAKKCMAYLQKEYAATAFDPTMPRTEDIGNGIVRVNLAAVRPEEVEQLGSAFLRSAEAHRGTLRAFSEKLEVLKALCAQNVFAFSPEALAQYLEAYEKAGYPAVSHSEPYRAAYHPAYRILLASMANEDLVLMRPTREYARQIAEYRQEFLDAGSSMDGCGPLRRLEDPEEYIRLCAEREIPEKVPAHLVPATQFLFVRKRDNRLVGMLQVRHRFTEFLEQYAGHIGYSVRPSERRKGYAKQMLHAALPFCREIGIEKLLIACIDGNLGSEKTILANGGVYESTVHEPKMDVDLKRFWICL